ncbi:MAG: hypothetical protein HKN25_14605 [Pyrinomonadaceae bacterium]|nr:hypothetical protein [Pyrinomonadaceae bacterium]
MFINKPDLFSFRNTIYSHGWSELAPFSIDEKNWRLNYLFTGEEFAKPIPVRLSETPKKIKVEFLETPPARKHQNTLRRKIAHVLRFDEDLSGFYEATLKEKSFSWMLKTKSGRLLRSASVFEDLVKTICTTNCSWSLTKNMVSNLVDKLGDTTADGRKAFPTAAAMAEADEKFYREEVRAGYRAPYFAELAKRVLSGEIDPEEWLTSDLPTSELKKEMKKVKGVGDYAAENLLKLVGRYDGLALDSWLRSEFYRRYNKEKKCSDKKIERFYGKFGKWQGLAIWFDMSRKWLD